jgi:CheY-like chemotaxis protein
MARIMIVEDQPLISIMLEEMVTELGHVVCATVADEKAGLAALMTEAPDLALLDINLRLCTSFKLADACRDRGVHPVFMTGYSVTDVPEECGNAPVLTKPFSAEELERGLRDGLGQPVHA